MANSIYIIIDKSSKWDDDAVSPQINFVSTSLDEADKIWNNVYSKMSECDDSKYHYNAELREYCDGFDIYSLDKSKFKIIKEVSN